MPWRTAVIRMSGGEPMSFDFLIAEFDRALRTLAAPARSARPHPDSGIPEASLDAEQRRHAAALMRVNHCGEVCAQALYQGQSLTSRDAAVGEALCSAADEETEHLAWTERRIAELGGRTSRLNPLWYLGSLGLGLAAGILGDKWNLGFLAETERQVEAHLAGHLSSLPASDARSLAIVEQMRRDEIAHAETAVRFGAAELPAPVKVGMRLAAAVMTRTAYHV